MKQPDKKCLASLKARYAKANKAQRGKILDEFVATTGCHRKHASAVLTGKRAWVNHPIRRPRARSTRTKMGAPSRVWPTCSTRSVTGGCVP